MPQPYPNGELVVVIDCSDLDRSARFWAAVLGYEAGLAATGPYRSLTPVSGVGIDVLLQRVPDVKRQKNRLHPDLRTPDLEAEVARVLDLGATLRASQSWRPTGAGTSWPIRTATSSASCSPQPDRTAPPCVALATSRLLPSSPARPLTMAMARGSLYGSNGASREGLWHGG